MSIFEKIDTTRHQREIHLCKPLSQPDATGFSEAETDVIADPMAPLDGSSEESSGKPPEPLTSIANSVHHVKRPKACDI